MISSESVRRLLNYDQETGDFTWAVKQGCKKPGDDAGYLRTDGYLYIKVLGRQYLAHQLAWLHFYGEFPDMELDHINHVRADNRISNLREVSRSQNNKNMPRYKNNKSGVTGVSWYRSAGKWRAQIRVEGKKKHLGLFDEIKDAAKAVEAAEAKYGYHENHGKSISRD